MLRGRNITPYYSGTSTWAGYNKGLRRTTKAQTKKRALFTNKKALATMIRAEISKAKVEKCYTAVQTGQTVNNTLTGATDAYFLLNNIAKGVDDYQRDGDSIALRALNIKGNVEIQNFTSSQFALGYCTILVLNCKSNPQATSVNLPWTSLLDINGAYQGWTSAATDRCLDINTDDFSLLYRKEIKLSDWSVSAASVLTTSSTDSNNMFCPFDINLKYKDKHVQYEAGTTNPSTFNPFICFVFSLGTSFNNSYTAVADFVTKTRFVDDN